jgi:hypothetical protein
MSARSIVLAIVLLASPPSASGFSYSETTEGDIPSYDENAPTPLGALDAGANVLSGTVTTFTDWGDVFSVDVPVGLAITDVVLVISGHTGGFQAFAKIFETPVYQGLDSHLFASDGVHSFTAALPLPAPGPYGFTAAFIGAETDESYAWQWTITTPEPAASLASLAAWAALGAMAGARRAGCGRRASRATRGSARAAPA